MFRPPQNVGKGRRYTIGFEIDGYISNEEAVNTIIRLCDEVCCDRAARQSFLSIKTVVRNPRWRFVVSDAADLAGVHLAKDEDQIDELVVVKKNVPVYLSQRQTIICLLD